MCKVNLSGLLVGSQDPGETQEWLLLPTGSQPCFCFNGNGKEKNENTNKLAED